ncbi:MAG: PucR family transcriptional regulator [Moorellaceae bacterium]
MLITIPMILDRLPNRRLEDEEVFNDRKTNIQEVVLLDSTLSAGIRTIGYKDNILYIMQEPLTVKDLNGFLPMNLLYIHNGYGFYTGKLLENRTILILEGISDAQELVSKIREAILYYREMADRLLSMVQEDAGLQTLTNEIAAYLRNPVAIFARGLKLLAHSQNYTMNYKPWLETIEKGYLVVEENVSHLLQEQSKMSQGIKSPFIFYAEGMRYRIAVKNIIKGNEEIGIFQVIEYNYPITRGALDLMEALNVYLAIELNKRELIRYNNTLLHAQLIADLLENRVNNLQELKKRSENLGWLLAKYLFVLAIKPVSHFLVGQQLSWIRDQLNIIIPSSHCIVYDKGIVVIINKNTDSPFTKETETRLIALLKEWGLCCGLSQCSTNILEASRLYKQSLQAIKFGLVVHPERFIYDYSSYALHDFFDTCLQNENISSYYHPAVAVLKDYDAKHQGELLETLRTYINNHNNQIATAKQMHIHRSALLYRLRKIEELTGVDLHNPDTIFHLQLSFKLLEHEKHFSMSPGKMPSPSPT